MFSRVKRTMEGDMKTCPYCSKKIDDAATACEYCGANLVRRYSKGGLVATGVLAVLGLFVVVGPGISFGFHAGHLGYGLALVALFIRSFRLPMRWWQGILICAGGFIIGASFAPDPPGPPLTKSESILMLLLSVGAGFLLILIGFWGSRRQRPVQSADSVLNS